jgi:hypothetical protein
MEKILKTAPELEQLILVEMGRAAICTSVCAVTVTPIEGNPDTNWECSHINVPGGAVPQVCVDLCAETVAALRDRYDLLLDIEADEL